MRREIIVIILVLILTLVVLGFFFFPELCSFCGKMAEALSSAEAFKEYTLAFGIWAPAVFFLTSILQVILAPIPGNVVALAGGALFGAVKGFILSGAGIVIGSVIAFYLARLCGQPLVIRLIGERVFTRYNRAFAGKYFFALFFMFLLPFFPDDALCFLAGLSTLPLSLFLLLVLTGRMPGILLATLLGAGVINLTIREWSLVAVIFFALILAAAKYWDRLQEWLSKKLGI